MQKQKKILRTVKNLIKFFNLCFLMILLLFSIGYALANPNGVEKVSNNTTFVMEWNQTFEGELMSVAQTTDGGFILAGNIKTDTESDSLWLVKTDATGHHEWNQTFYGVFWWIARRAVIQTTDGGFAVVGRATPDVSDLGDLRIIKTDTTGIHEWNQTIHVNGEYQYHCSSIIQLNNKGFALCGMTGAHSAGQGAFLLVKTDATGHHEWNQTYGGVAGEWAISMVQTADGGFVLAGETFSFGVGGVDAWLVKANATGHQEWNQTYGGIAGEWAEDIIQTTDGGFAFLGTTNSYGAGGSDFWLVKTDTNGNIEWDQTYGGLDLEFGTAMVQTTDGGFALAGSTGLEDQLHTALVVKTDAAGNHEFNQTFEGSYMDSGIGSMVQTTDGGLVLAGSNGEDGWLLKIIEGEVTTTERTDYPLSSILFIAISVIIIRVKRSKH